MVYTKIRCAGFFMSNYIMQEYDDALSSILNEGFVIDGDRTGVGTICKFGISTKYDISKRFPILTKRKIFYKSIFKEVFNKDFYETLKED